MTKAQARKLQRELRQVQLEGNGLCESIRTLVHVYYDLPVTAFLEALPNVNPSTLRIQYRKSHRIIAELEAL